MNLDARNQEMQQRLDGIRFHSVEANEIEAIVLREVQAESDQDSSDQDLKAKQQESSSHQDRSSQQVESESFDARPVQHWVQAATKAAKLDQSIEAKLNKVECPSDLAQRLKQATRAQKTDDANGISVNGTAEQNDPWTAVLGNPEAVVSDSNAVMRAASHETEEQTHQSSAHRKRRSSFLSRVAGRKSIAYGLIALVAVGMMTSIGIAVIVLNQPPELISRERLSHETISWKRIVDDQAWNQDPAKRLDSYPINSDLLLSPHQWMEIRTKYDPSTVVYNATPPGQKQVIQFTIRSNRSFNLERLMPSEPIYETSAYCIGACYDDGFVYVLFVEGDEDRYHQVLRRRLPAG